MICADITLYGRKALVISGRSNLGRVGYVRNY